MCPALCNRRRFNDNAGPMNLSPRMAPQSCCALVDGRNALGAVVSRCAMELAISKARAHGVGWVVCKGSNHFGAAGYWAEQAARQHLLAFSFTNTAPFMVPTGGRTRAVSRPAA